MSSIFKPAFYVVFVSNIGAYEDEGNVMAVRKAIEFSGYSRRNEKPPGSGAESCGEDVLS
jgi:hypothetical protein